MTGQNEGDPKGMDSPSRRDFMAQMVSTAAVGALATLPGQASAASALTSSSGIATPDDESYWRWVADQFVIRDDITYLNTGTRGPSPLFEAETVNSHDMDRRPTLHLMARRIATRIDFPQ